MPEVAPQLEYAPAPRGLKRRAIRRWVIFAAVVLMLICFGRRGYHAGRAVVTAFGQQAEIVRRQAGLARYTAPADLVIVSDEPSDIARLGPVIGYYKVDLKPRLFSGNAEKSNRLKAQASRAAVFYVPPSGRNRFMFIRGLETSAFAHMRRASANSEERLVTALVEHWSTGAHYPNDRALAIEAMAQRPAGYWPYAKGEWCAVARIRVKVGPDDHFRVFAGQVDPDDAARFTIGYTLNGQAGVIAGRLLADHTIALTQSGAGEVVDP